MFKGFLAAAAAAALLIGGSAGAQAQNAHEVELAGFHTLCDHGDRRACIRFGMLLERQRDMHEAWRRSHPEFFWWER